MAGGVPVSAGHVWRELPIGRIMRAPDLPSHVPQWHWTCNFYGKSGGGGSGSGDDLDHCKRQFKAASPERMRCGGDSGAQPRRRACGLLIRSNFSRSTASPHRPCHHILRRTAPLGFRKSTPVLQNISQKVCTNKLVG
jgi:hypothetical protein